MAKDGEATPGKHRGRENLRPAWEPGKSGNPAGRPKGSRNQLAEDFLADLRDEWKRRGASAVKNLPDDKLCDVVVRTLPKDVHLDVGENLSDMIRRAADVLASRGK